MTDDLAARIWTTKDGRKTPWGEMTRDHLRNAAALIRRNAKARLAAYWLSGFTFQGDEAAWSWASHEYDEQAIHDGAMQYAAEMEAFAAREEVTQ